MFAILLKKSVKSSCFLLFFHLEEKSTDCNKGKHCNKFWSELIFLLERNKTQNVTY